MSLSTHAGGFGGEEGFLGARPVPLRGGDLPALALLGDLDGGDERPQIDGRVLLQEPGENITLVRQARRDEC